MTALSGRIALSTSVAAPDKSNDLTGWTGLDFLSSVMKFCFVFLFAVLAATAPPAMAAGAYPGCAAPPSVFAKSFTATPATFASILNAAAAGDVIYLNSGAYGAVSIANRKYAQFLTIKAAQG
jgi:hypothetical protein